MSSEAWQKWQKKFEEARKKDNESMVASIVKEYLQSLPHTWFFKPSASIYGERGIPDFVVCWQGAFLVVETKKPSVGEKGLTAYQQLQKAKILSARGIYFTVWDFESFIFMLNYTSPNYEW
jgi:hypothetical protein